MLHQRSEMEGLFRQIRQGDKPAFDTLFTTWYPKLLSFASHYIKQPETAEELISELFVKLWLRRQTLDSILHPEAYLYTSVKNACLNLIRSDKKRLALFTATPVEKEKPQAQQTHPAQDKELMQLLTKAVASLPEQRRMVFKLIKEDGLKSSLVAELMGLSKRTVENQLYKALKTIAAMLSSYLGYNPQQQNTKKETLAKLSMLFIF